MRILLISTLVLWAALGQAQDFEAGIFMGGSFYSGDLSPRNLPRYTRFMEPAGGLVMRIRGKGVLGARLSLNYTNLRGDDTRSSYPERGLAFETNLMEASLVGEWYLIPDNFLGDRPTVEPFLFAGVAAYHFNPAIQLPEGWVELQPIGTEGQGLEGYEPPYKRTQFAVPFGAGLRWNVNRRSAIGFEISGRWLFTDYLDDVSGDYLNYTRIYEEKGELAAKLSRPSVSPEEADKAPNIFTRGGDKNDAYAVFGLSYTFRLSR